MASLVWQTVKLTRFFFVDQKGQYAMPEFDPETYTNLTDVEFMEAVIARPYVGSYVGSDSESPGDIGNVASDSETVQPTLPIQHAFRRHWKKDDCCAECGECFENHHAPEWESVLDIAKQSPKLTAKIHKLNSAYSVLVLRVEEQSVRVLLTPSEYEQLVELGLEVVEPSASIGW